MNKASIPEDAFIFPLIFTADFASIIDSSWKQRRKKNNFCTSREVEQEKFKRCYGIIP